MQIVQFLGFGSGGSGRNDPDKYKKSIKSAKTLYELDQVLYKMGAISGSSGNVYEAADVVATIEAIYLHFDPYTRVKLPGDEKKNETVDRLMDIFHNEDPKGKSEEPFNYVTNNYGLRDKVKELVKARKRA
jgi:hypothetical protein